MIQLQLGFGGERKVIYHRGCLEEKGKLDFHCYSLLHRHFLLREIDLPFETYFQTLLFSFLNRMMFARMDTALDPRIVARVTESTFVVKSPLIQRTHTHPILQKLTRMGCSARDFYGRVQEYPFASSSSASSSASTLLDGFIRTTSSSLQHGPICLEPLFYGK